MINPPSPRMAGYYQFSCPTGFKTFRHYFANDYGIVYSPDGQIPQYAFFTHDRQQQLFMFAKVIDNAALVLERCEQSVHDKDPRVLQYSDLLKGDTCLDRADVIGGGINENLRIETVKSPIAEEMLKLGVESFDFHAHGGRMHLVAREDAAKV